MAMRIGEASGNFCSEFQDPPLRLRPRPLWMWNDTRIHEEGIREQMRMMRDAGFGGCNIIPFGHGFEPEYLGEAYFSLYGVVLQAAEELGMKVSLYDELGFPSGSVGSRNSSPRSQFAEEFPELLLKRLDKCERMVKGPAAFEWTLPAPAGSPKCFEAVVAMNSVTFERRLLEPRLDPDTGECHIQWDVPRGDWQIMVFSCVTDGEHLCDYLDEAAGSAFLKLTHERYFQHFSNYFGTVLDSTFHDEPTLFHAQGRTWTHGITALLRERHGIDPRPLLPALWYEIGPVTAAARAAFFGLRTELYAKGFVGVIDEWARTHGIDAMGHQDQEEAENPVSVSGDLIACFEHQTIPGIDKIGGNRAAERFYKVVASAACNYDRAVVMSETYAAMGNLPWEEIYQIALDQYSAGINMLIPHGVWFDDSNVYYKPELSPRNPLYAAHLQEFNTFLGRLNVLLQNDAAHVADVAVLYPIDGMNAAHHFDGELGPYRGGVAIPESNYIRIAEMLSRQLAVDFRFVHPDVLDARGSVADGRLHVSGDMHPGEFPVVVLPSMRAIRPSTVDLLGRFLESGGALIAIGPLPVRSTSLAEAEALAGVEEASCPIVPDRTKETSFGAAGRLRGLFADYPNAFQISDDECLAEDLRDFLQKALPDPDVRVSPSRDIGFLHKRWNQTEIYFVANLANEAHALEIDLRGSLDLEVWDPHSGDVRPLECRPGPASTARTITTVEIPARQGVFLVEIGMGRDREKKSF